MSLSVLGTLFLGAALAQPAPLPLHDKDPLASLRPGHPRLLLTVEREVELRAAAQRDPFLAELVRHLRQAADRMLEEPVEEYRLVGPRLLAQSRACLGKVGVLALAARWYDDARYVERAWRELEAAAAFPDWNPSHFLDTAEMSAAFALGYDWLYDRWTPEQRAFLRDALIEKGLRPGLAESGAHASARENNWNPVTNAGLSLAALAVAGEEPLLATQIVQRASANLPNALQYYAPDGAWYEGPGYWKYGTTYLAILAGAFETALGHDGGIGRYPGLARTGDFFRDAIGPSGFFFNYADSDPRPGSSPALFWLARRFHAPHLANLERSLLERHLTLLKVPAPPAETANPASLVAVKQGDVEAAELVYSNRFFPLEIIWYHPGSARNPPLRSSHYRGVVDVAFLRSSPGGPGDFFVGIKGSGVPNAHAHLDAGSFVLEARGQRWVEDLGMEDYDLPGFWERNEDGRRWNYFRTGSLSHNVVTLDGRNQRTPAVVPLTAFLETSARSHARFDLTDAYREQAAAAHRGFALLEGETLLVQDEFTGLDNGAKEARWAMLTGAHVAIDGTEAVLSLGGETLTARLLEPVGAMWEATAASAPTPEEQPNPGKTLVVAKATLTPGNVARFVVVFTTRAGPLPLQTPLPPLAAWTDAR